MNLPWWLGLCLHFCSDFLPWLPLTPPTPGSLLHHCNSRSIFADHQTVHSWCLITWMLSPLFPLLYLMQLKYRIAFLSTESAMHSALTSFVAPMFLTEFFMTLPLLKTFDFKINVKYGWHKYYPETINKICAAVTVLFLPAVWMFLWGVEQA